MASYYLDNKITNSSGTINIPSVGFVTPLKSSTTSDWRRTNLGFALIPLIFLKPIPFNRLTTLIHH